MTAAEVRANGDTASASPSAPRIATLDFVRGIAVMGILTMNIIAFAMPEGAYTNPRAYGGESGLDLGVYLFNFVLFDGKMRGLFSFLFGASTLFVIERAEARGASPARTHYARMGWLFVFGVVHLLFVWWGDILHHYALVGLVLFAFRDWPVQRLVRLGVVLVAVQTLVVLGLPLSVARAQADATGPHPSAAAITDYRGYQATFGVPPRQWTDNDLALHRAGYSAIVADRAGEAPNMIAATLAFTASETLAYMLFGMAALKSGMLRGTWGAARYRRWAFAGFGIALPAYMLLGAYTVWARFTPLAITLGIIALTTPFRPAMILGWAALLAHASCGGGWLVARVAAAGRMAFTNYLMTSLLMTTLFYGYGFGLYGHLGRAALYPIVAAMWALMLLWSAPWLARFHYGPFEWLWRSLARGAPQPMRRTAANQPRPNP